MKRLTAILLSIALLLTLCACGAKNESASSAGPTASAPPEVSTVENEAGYVIPSAWTETSINDGTWGYVTAAADLTPGSYTIGSNCLLSREQDPETGVTTLTLTRVPADQVPEKAPIRLAVPLSDWDIENNCTWADSLDQLLIEAINQFNRGSSEYRVEVETYSSAEELNLMLVSGEVPDLLFFDQGRLEQEPSGELLAKKGYLADLEPLFDADPELSMEDFIPNILELVTQETGGFYVAPIEFYFTVMTADRDYVGDATSWTCSDMLAAARTMPEDMTLWGSDSLISGLGCIGTATQFYEEELLPALEQDQSLVGYPGTGGGVSVIFYSQISMMAQATQQEGAWAFLRTLWAYDFQSGTYGTMFSVRQDAFNDKLSWRREVNSAYTETMDQTVRELVYGAQNVRTNDSTIIPIIQEEAAAFFNGDKTAEETARIIQNRISIYLGEQS